MLKRKRGEFNGGIVSAWLTRARTNPVPWCRNRDYQDNLSQKDVSDREKMVML
jgi:hypothetical protein